jgi:hypothetical protein
MFTKFKFNLAIVCLSLFLLAFTSLAPSSSMFGKKYHSKLDFTCCKGDQLYVHHFYTKQFFWVEVNNGYDIEPIGKPSAEGCNIQCED